MKRLTLDNDIKMKTSSAQSNLSLSLASSSSSQNLINIIRSSEVEEDKKIELNDNTIYQFDCIVNDNYISLILTEIDLLAPFVYQRDITLKELIEINKIFRACDDLNEVKNHFENLFKKKMIKLSQDENQKDKITFKIEANNISRVEKFEIVAERVMTEYKGPYLMKLYNIEKAQEKYIKGIESILEKYKNSPLSKKIIDIIQTSKFNMN